MKIEEFDKKNIIYVANEKEKDERLGIIKKNRSLDYQNYLMSSLNCRVLTFQIFSKDKKYEMRGGNKTNKYEFYIRDDGSLDTNPIYE